MAKSKKYLPDYNRLCQAIMRDRLALRKPRESRREMVREYVGRNYSEEGSYKTVYQNLLSLYVQIVGRSLIPQNPRVMLSTFNKQYEPVVKAEQRWINQELVRIRFQKTMQRIVTDAFFSMGIAKVALAKPADAASVAWKLKAGHPYISRVDLDDFVFDMKARDFEEVSYIGHRIRVPLDSIKDSKMYSKARKDLSPSAKPLINQEGDERIDVISRTYYGDQEDLEDMVDLWEIYLPRHRIVVTLPDSHTMSNVSGNPEIEPLLEQNWIGSDFGPYMVLGFGVVPGNILPKGPLQDIFDLHLGANRSMRKAVSGIDRLKEVTAVQQGGGEDGQRVLDASDGDIIQVNNPDRMSQIKFSGNVVQMALMMAQTLKQEFSFCAGNLEMMGGLSPQSKTLGQDQMLEQNASKTVQDMQETTLNFTSDVLNSLLWFHHHDPISVHKTEWQPEGSKGDFTAMQKTYPNNPMVHGNRPGRMVRNIPWDDLDMRVDPYSMQHQTPQSRLSSMNQVVTQIVIPMMQILTQAGTQFDVNAYLKKVGEYMDMPDLADILTIGDVNPGGAQEEQGEEAAGPAAGPKPAETKRTYERVSRPGSTPAGSTQNILQQLHGVNPGGNSNNVKVPQGA